MEFVDQAQAVWPLVKGAPFLVLLLIALLSLVIWLILNWRYQATIESLKSRLELKDDRIVDYERKLDVGSPDEAKAKLKELELRLDLLEPKIISADAQGKMTAALRCSNGVADIVHDISSRNAQIFADNLARVFREAGWEVRRPMVMGVTNPPISGLSVKVKNPNQLTEVEKAAVSSINAAALRFDLDGGLMPDPDSPEDIRILVMELAGKIR